jgi:hypothetical protein
VAALAGVNHGQVKLPGLLSVARFAVRTIHG